MNNLSPFMKWVGGIVAAVITGVLIFWLTDGLHNGNDQGNKSENPGIVIKEPEKPEVLPSLAVNIDLEKADLKAGESETVKITSYDVNHNNQSVGNAEVKISVSAGNIREATSFPKNAYTGYTNQEGKLSFTYEAPTLAPGGGKMNTVATQRITISVSASANLAGKAYQAQASRQFNVH